MLHWLTHPPDIGSTHRSMLLHGYPPNPAFWSSHPDGERSIGSLRYTLFLFLFLFLFRLLFRLLFTVFPLFSSPHLTSLHFTSLFLPHLAPSLFVSLRLVPTHSNSFHLTSQHLITFPLARRLGFLHALFSEVLSPLYRSLSSVHIYFKVSRRGAIRLYCAACVGLSNRRIFTFLKCTSLP